MRRLKTTLWISLGLVSVTLCLIMTAYLFGLMPDGHKAELNSRAKIAEALAVQLAGAVNRNDSETVEETLSSVVDRNSDVLSVAFRRENGSIMISHGDHSEYWKTPASGSSTPTHVFVPLQSENGGQGQIEIAFGPLSTGERLFDIPVWLFVLLGFVSGVGFIAYSLFLRRTLHELDPGRVIPERVQKAFDTLSEGVIILDERERILLVNSSFAKIYGDGAHDAIGSRINSLPWRMVDGRAKAGGYPWHAALKKGEVRQEDVLSLRTVDGKVRNLNVNAAVFTGEKDETIGAIVTVNDTTEASRNAEQLEKAIELLKRTQNEVERQKQELDYLSNYDPLTGCLNRNAFFAEFEAQLLQARRDGQPTTILMLDVDELRSIRENFGPAVADSLVISAADVIRSTLSDRFLIARYGGEGFCIALVGLQRDGAVQIMATIRSAFTKATASAVAGLDLVTLSAGLCLDVDDKATASELVGRADQALQTAMNGGRGQTAHWADTKARIEPVARLADEKRPVSNSAGQQPDSNALEEKQRQRVEGYHAQTRFLKKVESSIERARHDEKPLAVLKLGITSWEYFEEALGDDLSQALLRFAKRQVEIALREHDSVTLLPETGEMLVELSQLDEAEDVTWVVKRILEALSEPIKVGEQSVYVVCKIGAAFFPYDGQDPLTLARHAGVALRRAREENRIESLKFYAPEMTQTSFRNLEIETGIREALQRDEFELYFQPIINAQTGAVTAAETLLRCNSQRLSQVRTDQIIQVAERSSLIAEIDIWVVKSALRQMQHWHDIGLDLEKISINISAKQLTNIEFMDRVYEMIAGVSFAIPRIQIEVTETARMADVEVAAPQLKRLQQMGVYIALDDFGTGQASLTYLQRLHPDVIKIDRSFVEDVHQNHANATMVGTMTVMAHCLGLKVIAEGVETDEELDFLRETGCDDIQGYLVSKPMPAAAMGDWIRLFSSKQFAELGSPVASDVLNGETGAVGEANAA